MNSISTKRYQSIGSIMVSEVFDLSFSQQNWRNMKAKVQSQRPCQANS